MHSWSCSFIALFLLIAHGQSLAFSFSEEEAKQQASDEPKATAPALSAACRDKLKSERVLLLVAERGNQGVSADQSRFALHFQGIGRRLQEYGMRIYSQEEIRRQVAQAEIDAQFRNDPDAALNASKRLGATLMLRGVISARQALNPVLHINEVAVNTAFSLAGSNGRRIADASASMESYSGTDTVGMAATLIEEHAEDIVGRLLGGYCASRSKANGK